MPKTRGVRTYWKPSTTGPGAPKQILKNSGYISIVLQGVQYKARGNWWQQTFGGSDKIVVSTQMTWENTTDSKTAAAIQDFRKISIPSINPLAIGRNVVLKVPAVADGIEMKVTISAIHDDNLGKTLQMLNSDEFRQPLQLAPVAVGQILTIATLVKKTFTDVDSAEALAATYPGIISEGSVADPVANNRLVQGNIIILVKQDEEDQLDYNADDLTVTGNGVLAKGTAIPNTYVVYNVSFDQWRGRDFSTAWSKKYDQASSKVDELIFADPTNRVSIITGAYDLLKEGGALLDADDNFIKEERTNLKKSAVQEVKDKIASNAATEPKVALASRFISLKSTIEAVGAMEKPMATIEFGDEDIHADVVDYARALASAGLPFGFTFRPRNTPD